MRAFLMLLALALAGCSRTPDELAIRQTIESMADAVEAHRSGGLLDHVAGDFVGNDGLDRVGLERLLRVRMLAAQAIGVRIGPVSVEVQGDRATARFAALLTDSSGRWIPDRATTLQFETGWRRDGRNWLCYHAKWLSDAR